MTDSKGEKEEQQAAAAQAAQTQHDKQKKENEVTAALAAQAAVKKDPKEKPGATTPKPAASLGSKKRKREASEESDATTAERILLEGSKHGAQKVADATGLSSLVDNAIEKRQKLVAGIKERIAAKLSGSSMQPPPNTAIPAAAMQNTAQSAQQATPRPKAPEPAAAPAGPDQPTPGAKKP